MFQLPSSCILSLMLYCSSRYHLPTKEFTSFMPQDKRRVYRQQMLAERRRLQKALELMEAGETPLPDEHPTNREGQPMTAEQIKERILDLERQLHLKPSEA